MLISLLVINDVSKSKIFAQEFVYGFNYPWLAGKSLFWEFDFLVEMKLGCPTALILSGMAMANFWDAVNAPFMHLGIPQPTHSPIQCLSGGLCFTFLPSSCLWWGGWCVLNRGCQSPGWPLLIVMYLVMSALYLILSPLKPIGPIN